MLSNRYLKIVFLGALIFSGFEIFCQHSSIQNAGTVNEKETDFSLEEHYNFTDSAFLEATLIVLKQYPELEKLNIEFSSKKINTMMAARPSPGSVFKKKEKRNYKIFISTNPKNNSKKIFEKLSVNAKIGIISHEFAHILCYNKKSGFQLFLYGITYYFNKRNIERETDQIAIQRGFGRQLIEYDQFIIFSNLVSKKYLDNKARNYLSIVEIQKIVDK